MAADGITRLPIFRISPPEHVSRKWDTVSLEHAPKQEE